MNASPLFQSSRRGLLTLVVAAILALTAAYAPVVVDNLAGTALVTLPMRVKAQGAAASGSP